MSDKHIDKETGKKYDKNSKFPKKSGNFHRRLREEEEETNWERMSKNKNWTDEEDVE